ncbi:MAG: response regulator [Desulfobacula sp.]|nr:response regulator [Desulfobacula sp.]
MKAQKIADEQKKLALVGQVAGKMAHDFNNILGIIMGNAELALLDCESSKIKRTLSLIHKQTIRGKNLTKNLIVFAKDQEPKQEFFKLNEKIDLVVNLLRKDLEEIKFLREDKPDVPELLADPGMIEHALVNLIQNSIHATSQAKHPRIIMRTYSNNKNICFEIEDNGCGIPNEHLKNIYEPSFTLKGSKDTTGSYMPGIKGTGYGMANVKKYVNQHKGNIGIESKTGSGTKIIISLPVIKKELTFEEKIKIQKEITQFEKYILLVEDETAISDVQYKVLTQSPCNHKVDIANNGKVAMDLFDRNEYDFVSLDYILPWNINGMDVYNHIRETNKKIPILFISGNIEFLESVKELMRKDNHIDHQSKPCQNKDYVTTINKLLEKD